MFRVAIKEYNQYKDNVFDQDGKFINLPQDTFDDIFLDESIRNIVQTNIIDYIDEKKVILKKRNGIPTKRGVIFAGDPGTGKTFLSRVLANTLKITFMVITNISSLEELKNVFKFASQFDRIILLFEDIDIYVQNRDLGSRLLPTMLNELDGIEAITNHLVVICTTNNVESFDKALKNRPGRFDLIIPFDRPSKCLKHTMLQGLCKGKVTLNVDFEKIVAKVPEAYTGAHLKELYISACVLAIEENSIDEKGAVILTTNIFERALNRIEKGIETVHKIGFDSK
jgi:cell division protease FtsH